MLCTIVQPIHEAGVAALERAGVIVRTIAGVDESVVVEGVRDADAIIVREAPFPPAALEAARRTRLIAKHGVGVNNLDLARARALGIPITFTPGANVRATAEHALALMLACARHVPAADRAVREGNWAFRYRHGLELGAKTLGVVGFGPVGRTVAEIARGGFGMPVIVWSPSVAPREIAATGATPAGTIDELLRVADIVSIHRPLRPDTVNTIGARELALMKPSAILVNTARGGLVDETALAAALAGGRLYGAGLDVFAVEPLAADSPLTRLGNVVLAPHVATATAEAMRAMAERCAAQVLDAFADREPHDLVDRAVWQRRRR